MRLLLLLLAKPTDSVADNWPFLIPKPSMQHFLSFEPTWAFYNSLVLEPIHVNWKSEFSFISKMPNQNMRNSKKLTVFCISLACALPLGKKKTKMWMKEGRKELSRLNIARNRPSSSSSSTTIASPSPSPSPWRSPTSFPVAAAAQLESCQVRHKLLVPEKKRRRMKLLLLLIARPKKMNTFFFLKANLLRTLLPKSFIHSIASSPSIAS